MTKAGKYTTQLQAGLALIQETRLLLAIWKPGMSAKALYQEALRSGQFPNISARRLRNVVVECFAPRYLVSGGKPAQDLKRLSTVFSTQEFTQLLLLYTCRANLILADFIRDVYWEKYVAGADLVSNEAVRGFIARAIDDGKMGKRWAESTIRRVSSYLTGCCIDYGLLGGRTRGGCLIVPYRIEPRVAAYLAHVLHFEGLGDNTVISHPDWQLFGLSRDDVREEFKRLSLKGHVIYQSAGEITHIGWNRKRMEDFVDVFAQS